jgi:hypothetical protein
MAEVGTGDLEHRIYPVFVLCGRWDMALYLVIHAPMEEQPDTVLPPTRMLDLARDANSPGSSPKWVSTFSPDLHDDRIFSLWEAENADHILVTLDRYGFLNHLSAQPIRVQQWGPTDVIAAESEATS